MIPPILAAGGAYEPIRLEYPELKPSYYTPDATLPNGIVVEVKGRFLPQDRAKHLALRARYPGLELRFVFDNPGRTLSKTSTTTYGAWCLQRGFRYAKKVMPPEWAAEPTNIESLRIIQAAPRRKVAA